MRCCGREERGCSSCGCGGCSCTACAGCGSGGGGGGGGKAHPPRRSDPEGVRGRDPLPTSASPTRQPRLQQQLLLPQRPLQRRVRRHPCVGRCRKSGFLFGSFPLFSCYIGSYGLFIGSERASPRPQQKGWMKERRSATAWGGGGLELLLSSYCVVLLLEIIKIVRILRPYL